MNEHQLNLAPEPFLAIASGKKIIESRLYDEKRQIIQLGDTIIFKNREDPSKSLKVKVVGLLRYKTFSEMFEQNDPKKFGGNNASELIDQINQFYSTEDQERFGVVGIQFSVPQEDQFF